MVRMPGRSHRGPLPPATAEQTRLAEELRKDVQALAGAIGERSRMQAQAASRQWIELALRAAGSATCSTDAARNVTAEIPGASQAGEIVIVGAHYDSVAGSPGANDNASGVAAMLALARRFAGTKPGRTLRFVAFADEEPPCFQTEQMGSLQYAMSCKAKGENIVAMLCLETLGFYRDEKGSQSYPIPLLRFLYPSRGDFVAIVGNVSSRALVRRVVGSFREHAAFPSEGGALPGWIPGVGWSDQWSFWQQGYPAVMVTDTAPFRYPHYHRASDTPDKLDYERLARVVDGLRPWIAAEIDLDTRGR
jgi:Zn-dependent M28 family amino/carboxypeptidase